MGRKTRFRLGLLIVALSLATTPCLGGSKTTVNVYGHVLPHLSQSIVHQEAGIHVTEEDLKRGYVEVPSGTVMEVRTNDRKGYFLFFEGLGDLFKEIWVKMGERTIVLGSNGGLILERPRGEGREVKSLSYRIYLKENTLPGFYPWPLTVRASLL